MKKQLTQTEIDSLKMELRSLDNGSICRSESEWKEVRQRQTEICELLNVEYPEDVI